MIFDDRAGGRAGVRYPSMTELSRFSGFVGPQRRVLQSLPTEKEALLIIAGAVTFNTSLCIYNAINDHAFGHFEKNYFLKDKLDTLGLSSDLDAQIAAFDYTNNLFNAREPRHNWTDQETSQGYVDLDLTVNDRDGSSIRVNF